MLYVIKGMHEDVGLNEPTQLASFKVLTILTLLGWDGMIRP